MRQKDSSMTTSSSGAPSLAGLSGTIVLVGVGKMGGALLEGWLALGLDPKSVIAIEPQPTPELTALTKRGLRLNPIAAIVNAAALVIAVKPQVAPMVMLSAKSYVSSKTVVLSIMAGTTLAVLEREFIMTAIVRAMPNTPASIGRGITVAVPNKRVEPSQRQLVDALLAATGAVEWIDKESFMDAVTAVSGSGPAYVFLLAESLAAGTGDETRARDGRGRRRIAEPLAARPLGLAAERHLTRRHHGGRARRADGLRWP
jgi:pyrroline-5-carboxylate reductase